MPNRFDTYSFDGELDRAKMELGGLLSAELRERDSSYYAESYCVGTLAAEGRIKLWRNTDGRGDPIDLTYDGNAVLLQLSELSSERLDEVQEILGGTRFCLVSSKEVSPDI